MHRTLSIALLFITAAVCDAREGDSMAPGAARLETLDARGTIRIVVLERVFLGTWKSAPASASVPLLQEHWRGARARLRDGPLAVAELTDGNGTAMRCEFISDPDNAVGVCEEVGVRLYYLRP